MSVCEVIRLPLIADFAVMIRLPTAVCELGSHSTGQISCQPISLFPGTNDVAGVISPYLSENCTSHTTNWLSRTRSGSDLTSPCVTSHMAGPPRLVSVPRPYNLPLPARAASVYVCHSTPGGVTRNSTIGSLDVSSTLRLQSTISGYGDVASNVSLAL